MHGDIAWGGNWFFLVADHGQALDLERTDALTDAAWAIRGALDANNITGRDGAPIDHIELFADSHRPGIDSRNFLLCPRKASDRSPSAPGPRAKKIRKASCRERWG